MRDRNRRGSDIADRLLHVQAAVQPEADEPIAILVASAHTDRER